MGNVPKLFFASASRTRREIIKSCFSGLFFDDKPDARPQLVAWDESGTEVLRSGELGSGIDLPSSDSAMIPMNGISAIDVEVPGDGKTVRGAYLDWMTSSEVVHPLNAGHQDVIPQPFSSLPPLRSPTQDTEQFGSVTASLAADTIRIGPSVQQGAAFQFGIEAQPLLALLTFEVASPRIDAPPEVYVNGENVGPVTLTLPELADPGYRGQMEPLVNQMQFPVHRLAARAENHAGHELEGRHKRYDGPQRQRNSGVGDPRNADSAKISLGEIRLSQPVSVGRIARVV